MITLCRIITVTIVSACALWILFNSIKIAVADLFNYRTKAFIERTSYSEKIDLSLLSQHQKNIEKVIRLNPINAQYYDYLARLHYLEVRNSSLTGDAYIKKIGLAYQNNWKATRLRPQWSHSWSNMALMKSELNQYDATFIHSINQANKYGAWEIANNETILQAGFKLWSKASDSMKDKLAKTFRRLYRQKKQSALTILQAYHNNFDICTKVLSENDLTYNKNVQITCR